MSVACAIVDGPLTPDAEHSLLGQHRDERDTLIRGGTIGAALRFAGVVRRMEPHPGENGIARPLIALEYVTYDPMALHELISLGHEIARQHSLSSLVALHSRGRVGVGETSFVLEVLAPRRVAALNAVGEFIDRLKRDVPIWKNPIWAR